MPVVYTVGQVLFAAALVGAVASLIVRFHHSTGIERQQLKWVAYVVCALAVVGPLAIAFYFDSVAVQVAIAVVVTAWPIAVCVAILRYRLYDIDIIINRTVVYGVVTVVTVVVVAGHRPRSGCRRRGAASGVGHGWRDARRSRGLSSTA